MSPSPSGHTPDRRLFGYLDDGRPVHRHEIGHDGLRLGVIELGAAVQSLVVDGPRGPVDVVLGSSVLSAYAHEPQFFGAVVGRVANRIAGASFDLDGKTHHVQADEGEHTLHGGPAGFHAQVWQVLEHSPSSLVLGLHSADGDGGFPGEVEARVTYAVEGRSVEITLEALPDRPTPLALTQHTHLVLGGEASGSALDHELHVRAARFTPVDDELIPTGEIASVEGTALDHRVTRQVDVQLDHNLVLDPAATRGEEPAAVLRDPVSGLTMTLHTDQPGLQVYAGGGFDGTTVGKAGTAYGPGAGIALEPQLFPDAVHHRGELGWPEVVATPERPFRSRLRWTFGAG